MSSTILFTIDVEDWFQVENFKSVISYDSWDRRELRVSRNVYRILDLLDEYDYEKKATFFVLGWVARKTPNMVREIHRRGHEVASHGMRHILYNTGLSRNLLIEDLKDSKALLEDIIGAKVFGFRAPSFSITDDALKMIKSCGYIYDSSLNSFDRHGRYGQLTMPPSKCNGIGVQIDENFFEIPISNYTFQDQVLPMGGGGYFRLLPFFMFQFFVREIIRRCGVYMFYMHPWEIDPDQPKVYNVRSYLKFRHYVNLKHNYKKLSDFLSITRHEKYLTCIEYVEQNLMHGKTL